MIKYNRFSFCIIIIDRNDFMYSLEQYTRNFYEIFSIFNNKERDISRILMFTFIWVYCNFNNITFVVTVQQNAINVNLNFSVIWCRSNNIFQHFSLDTFNTFFCIFLVNVVSSFSEIWETEHSLSSCILQHFFRINLIHFPSPQFMSNAVLFTTYD